MKIGHGILKPIPPRLIHMLRGIICDRTAQLSDFEHSQECRQLLVQHYLIVRKMVDHCYRTLKDTVFTPYRESPLLCNFSNTVLITDIAKMMKQG